MSEHGPAIEEVLEGQDDGLHVGAQLYVSVAGAPVLDVARGDARAGEPMRTDTIMPWFCGGKPLLAIALGQLAEQGRVRFDDPVAVHLPDVADPAVGAVTIADLLCHRVGFQEDGFIRAVGVHDWDTIVEIALGCPMEFGWDVRRRGRYSLWLAWVLLGEIVRRASGASIDAYVREHVFAPAGMGDCWLVMTEAEFRANEARMAQPHATFNGVIEPLDLVSFAVAGTCSPGFGARGPIRELGRLYEELLRSHSGEPSRLLQQGTLFELTRVHREGLIDELLNADTSFGLGFVADPRRFGEPCSQSAFGHPGMQSVIALADPAHDLVIAFAANGMPDVYRDVARQRAVVGAVYQQLGLWNTDRAGSQSRRRRRADARRARKAAERPLPAVTAAPFLSEPWTENLAAVADGWPRVAGATANVQFVFTDDQDGEELAVQLRAGRIHDARPGRLQKADVTITMRREIARRILCDEMDASDAISGGALAFDGSMMKLMRITPIRAVASVQGDAAASRRGNDLHRRRQGRIVATLDVTADEVIVRLQGVEVFGALRRRARVPRANVVEARVAEEPYKLGRGLRLPGLSTPSRRVGVFRGHDGRSFVAARRGQRGVELVLNGRPWDRLVVSVDDPEQVVARLGGAQ